MSRTVGTDAMHILILLLVRAFCVHADAFHCAAEAAVDTALESATNTLLLQNKMLMDRASRLAHKPFGKAPGGRSTCAAGKLLPQLYVLGAPKAGTTSLALDLIDGGIDSSLGAIASREAGSFTEDHLDSSKELKFFSSALNRHATWPSIEAMHQTWLSGMPPCPPADIQTVIADYSATNLELAPVPQPWRVENDWNNNTYDRVLPSLLHKFYGEELAQNLTFVVLIREPLARIQSEFYYFHHGMSPRNRSNDPGYGFEQYVNETLHDARFENIYEDLLWSSMYGQQLQGWLQHFNASQFVIVPMATYGGEDKSGIIDEISRRLRMPIDSSKASSDTHANSGEHPPLSEDISAATVAEFNRFLDHDHQILVQLLANASKEGASLGGYTGTRGCTSSIDAWLRSGWG